MRLKNNYFIKICLLVVCTLCTDVPGQATNSGSIPESIWYKNRILMMSLFIVLFFFFVRVSIYLYRKQKEKKQVILRKIKTEDTIAESDDKQEKVIHPENNLITDDYHQHQLFERLHTYLLEEKNFTKTDINTNRLISELSTNRSYLFDAVKTATGKTLLEYIHSLRLEEAKLLLETTDEVIDTIATVCGYSSVRTFYRLFRAKYNMSPASYRQMIRKKKKQQIIHNE